MYKFVEVEVALRMTGDDKEWEEEIPGDHKDICCEDDYDDEEEDEDEEREWCD